MRTVTGADLQVGDTVRVWWGDKRDTIRRFEPRAGDDPDLQQVAVFASGYGMTICCFEQYHLIEEDPHGS